MNAASVGGSPTPVQRSQSSSHSAIKRDMLSGRLVTPAELRSSWVSAATQAPQLRRHVPSSGHALILSAISWLQLLVMLTGNPSEDASKSQETR